MNDDQRLDGPSHGEPAPRPDPVGLDLGDPLTVCCPICNALVDNPCMWTMAFAHSPASNLLAGYHKGRWWKATDYATFGKSTKTESKLDKIKALVVEWQSKQGHDQCHYYPDIFNKIADELGLPRIDPGLPPRKEFEQGCKRFQIHMYDELREDHVRRGED